MNALLIYNIKAAVYLVGLYLVYRLLLSHDTLYERNRVFILLSVFSVMVLPMITIHTAKPLSIPQFGRVLSEILVTPGTENSVDKSTISIALKGYRWLSIIYLGGVIFCGIKFIVDLLELFVLIIRNSKKNNNVIRFHGLNTAGFSAFGYIFINEKLSPEESSEVIKHEQNHLELNHSLDIILIESVKVLQWFNPAIHLFCRSLRDVHEYQADEECLIDGIPLNSYQKLLLNQVFKSKIFTASNSFSNPSLLKKRMIMMTKRRSGSLANIKILMILPVTAIIMLAFSTSSDPNQSQVANQYRYADVQLPPPESLPLPPSQSTKNLTKQVIPEAEETEPFVVVEEMPRFPGGEIELLKHISDNTNYPESAKINGIQGKVIIRFAVDTEGNVTRVSVLKGVDPELNAEAIRVVKTLPKFVPGRQGGKSVPVWYMVPINFTLK
jgi:TonB family protein